MAPVHAVPEARCRGVDADLGWSVGGTGACRGSAAAPVGRAAGGARAGGEPPGGGGALADRSAPGRGGVHGPAPIAPPLRGTRALAGAATGGRHRDARAAGAAGDDGSAHPGGPTAGRSEGRGARGGRLSADLAPGWPCQAASLDPHGRHRLRVGRPAPGRRRGTPLAGPGRPSRRFAGGDDGTTADARRGPAPVHPGGSADAERPPLPPRFPLPGGGRGRRDRGLRVPRLARGPPPRPGPLQRPRCVPRGEGGAALRRGGGLPDAGGVRREDRGDAGWRTRRGGAIAGKSQRHGICEAWWCDFLATHAADTAVSGRWVG